MYLLVTEYPDYECGHEIEIFEYGADAKREFERIVEGIKHRKKISKHNNYIQKYTVYLCTVDSFYED